jgi:hypothetical protein
MKKKRNPASLLSPAVPSVHALQTTETHLTLLQKQKVQLVENVSLLYQLFFGAPTAKQEADPENSTTSEPDYYSSYE